MKQAPACTSYLIFEKNYLKPKFGSDIRRFFTFWIDLFEQIGLLTIGFSLNQNVRVQIRKRSQKGSFKIQIKVIANHAKGCNFSGLRFSQPTI